MLMLSNRGFVKCDTRGHRRGDIANIDGLFGVVVTAVLLQVYGPSRVAVVGIGADAIRQGRERIAERARRHRLPSALRYVRALDPRFQDEMVDD